MDSDRDLWQYSSSSSPGSRIRRARDRLRDLRQGLERSASNPCIFPRLA
jgi:hypothetical protein